MSAIVVTTGHYRFGGPAVKKNSELLMGMLIALIIIGWIATGHGSSSGGSTTGPAVTAPAKAH